MSGFVNRSVLLMWVPCELSLDARRNAVSRTLFGLDLENSVDPGPDIETAADSAIGADSFGFYEGVSRMASASETRRIVPYPASGSIPFTTSIMPFNARFG